MAAKINKGHIGLIILGALIVAFSIWWIVSAPKTDVSTQADAKHIFRNVTIAAKDVAALSAFYQNAFGFKPVKDNGEWASGNPQSPSVLLQIPEYKDGGPTFRIIAADAQAKQGPLQVYDLGYAHLCFEADDVWGTVKKIIEGGGSMISTFPKIEKEVAAYAKDPEGNVVEVHVPTPTAVTPQAILRLLNSVIRTKLQLQAPGNARIRFIHVNLISKDWKKLSNFYQTVFGAVPTGALRDYKDAWISNLVGVKDARIVGQHVALPGYSVGGPTFEIFTYGTQAKQGPLHFGDLGTVCTGFETKDLSATLKAAVDAGGKVIRSEENAFGLIQDPDGNLIQLKKI